LDNMYHSLNFVAAWIDQWLHVGWIHSHPVGHCPRRSGDPTYSGTKSSIAICAIVYKAEVFGK
jgi:hypothetical protein